MLQSMFITIRLHMEGLRMASVAYGLGGWQVYVRPSPHETFPNRARSIANGSRPVARVHTGATGTLVPVSRDHLATWNERARSIAIGRALSSLSCGRSSGRYGPLAKSPAVITRLIALFLPRFV